MITTEEYPKTAAVEFADAAELSNYLKENPLARNVGKLCLGRTRNKMKSLCVLVATYPDARSKQEALTAAQLRHTEYSRQNNRAVLQRMAQKLVLENAAAFHAQRTYSGEGAA